METELIPVHEDGTVMFQSPVKPGTTDSCRPVQAGDVTHAAGGGVFSGFWPVHRAEVVGGKLWWVVIGDDAR
ncbi:MAG: hypothetical protein ACYDC1_17425 [Limisphaerales bacterium]